MHPPCPFVTEGPQGPRGMDGADGVAGPQESVVGYDHAGVVSKVRRLATCPESPRRCHPTRHMTLNPPSVPPRVDTSPFWQIAEICN